MWELKDATLHAADIPLLGSWIATCAVSVCFACQTGFHAVKANHAAVILGCFLLGCHLVWLTLVITNVVYADPFNAALTLTIRRIHLMLLFGTLGQRNLIRILLGYIPIAIINTSLTANWQGNIVTRCWTPTQFLAAIIQESAEPGKFAILPVAVLLYVVAGMGVGRWQYRELKRVLHRFPAASDSTFRWFRYVGVSI